MPLIESPPWVRYSTMGLRGSMISARGFTPAPTSPSEAAAAETPDESEVVGETAPTARTLSTSVRRFVVATESMVWMLAEGRKAVSERACVVPAMPERLKVGRVVEAEALEALGNWLAKTTAPTARGASSVRGYARETVGMP